MASSSLSKMTVPVGGATDAGNGSQGLLMPKLKYRFRVFFDNFGAPGSPTTEMTKQVISFARPNLSIEEIAVPIYNSTLKLAGKPTWADATCEIRDDAGGQVSKLVGTQLQKQLDFFEMASAASGIDYKFQCRVQVLDGGNGAAQPQILEEWQLYGCYLKSADYGALNYGESAAVTINMTIAYDNANQFPEEQGVGATITRTLGDVITGAGQ